MQRGRLGSSANGQGKHQRVKVDVAIAEQLDGVLLSCVYMCALLFSDCARALFCGTPRQTCKQAAAVMLRRRQTNRPTLFRTHVQPCKEIYLTPYLGIMLMWFATSYLPFALCAHGVFAIFAGLARCAAAAAPLDQHQPAAYAEKSARWHFCPRTSLICGLRLSANFQTGIHP